MSVESGIRRLWAPLRPIARWQVRHSQLVWRVAPIVDWLLFVITVLAVVAAFIEK